MPTLSTITNRGQITIPAKLRKQLSITSGAKVLISSTGSTINIQALDNTTNVLDLYASVDPKRKSTSPKQALAQAKALKAQKTALQNYE